jgi:adenosylhomocysteinase
VKTADVADLGLADAGRLKIEWADRQMPVLAGIRERFAKERPLDGWRISACLHVTAETANLMRTLTAGGADAVLCSSNPLSTQDDVAASLVTHFDIPTYAIKGEDRDSYYGHIGAALDHHPQVTMDDGADLVNELHTTRTELLGDVVGGTEETTTGVLRLRALEAEERLLFPVIAVNEALTKHLFDNRYGTGQSTLDGILRATNILLAGRRVVVFGFGWCGKGVAMRARGAGASVIVCEVDPTRALEAKLDGFEVMTGREAAARGDVFITATGGRDVVARDHFAAMRDGAIVCNAGHFDVEVSRPDLEELAVSHAAVRPSVEQYVLADGRRINLLAAGRVVNLAVAEGHPASVMDMSFANQALVVEHLVVHAGALERRVHAVPHAIDRRIARLKLESLGVEIDTLTPGQVRYRHTWAEGT